jgi:hypothetical protein
MRFVLARFKWQMSMTSKNNDDDDDDDDYCNDGYHMMLKWKEQAAVERSMQCKEVEEGDTVEGTQDS